MSAATAMASSAAAGSNAAASAQSQTQLYDPLTREEILHMQQLIRDLVQGDANITGGSGGISISFGGAGHGGGSGPGAAGGASGVTLGSGSTDSADTFDQIPYIIKQIFQNARQEAFGDQLTAFCSRKEAEIERICNMHYQEFVQSVDQLLKVRAGTATMRDKIAAMNSELQTTGRKIVEKKAELIENRRTLYNIETALEAMQSCLFVLDIASRVNIQIANRKYYSALRMLDELRSNHLGLINQFPFSNQMREWIPFTQDSIRQAVVNEMNEWFVTVRETTDVIGRLAMELTAMRQDRANEILTTSRNSGNAAGRINVGTSMEMAINEEYDMDALDNENVHLDFTSLFQCIHIHDVLGKRAQFKAEYEENRRLQSDIIIGTVFSLRENDLTSFEHYIHQIAGFFVIEATVISATIDFRSRASVEALWQTAVNKMNTHISECLRGCENPDMFLNIKYCAVAFIQTMEIYGYSVTSLTDLMVSLLDRFSEIKKLQCADVLVKIIEEEDDYVPMVVNDQDELEEINKSFELPPELLKTPGRSGRNSDAVIFPKTLPFSKGFIMCCSCIRDFVFSFYRFADGFEQQSNEMDDLIKKSLENVLMQNLSGALLHKIPTAGLSILIQTMVNASWFEKACHQFEALLQEQRYTYKNVIVVLQATQSFEDTRSNSEKRIFEIINAKIDSFIEVADYNWEASEASNTPSVYLTELVEYLTTVMSSTLAILPSVTKSYVYFEAFDHLATALKSLLLGQQIKRITIPVLHSIDVDLEYLETFSRQIDDTSAGDSFTEIRQLVTYGKSENYEEILITNTKNKKYSRVDLGDAVILLDKIKNFDTSYFSKATAEEKQRKKDIENVLRLIKK